MHAAHAIMGLYCESPLHAGTGQAMGVVDLPIQREAHTGWPCVYGSGVKGALRDHAVEAGLDAAVVAAIFGPDVQHASDHAGALTVSDARLLLLPVRSLTGIFRWVTAPEPLHRLQRDARRLGIALVPETAVLLPDPAQDQAWVAGGGEGPVDVFLEEYYLQAEPRQELGPWLDALAALMGREDARPQLERRLVVVSNDLFSFLAQHATPVAAHVRLDPGTKTVARGALWYEETLPPDTVLYTLLSAGPDRRPESAGDRVSPEALREQALTGLDAMPYLQLGGNETVGMGWCRVTLVRPEGGQG
ncbi:Type III-B CRISPR module RAMP protein Cmr4 [Candidatus Hydrogenisulfobacillus filiaventi]|uniref:Type III-B CRISPR module RAMP protein Cmr4 n=1 Tax=Candidatus Hydrogenisulfobacillus filiaventi TaxID=2707344 RepID=A0A6F8ZDB8_9FIRM|nr:Type III-B CRISPR module RAMP protein Cmr4 [Candidatus Hydrogenisulfobacillus filiaventi]